MSRSPLPRAARVLARFPAWLRAHGFRVAPEQNQGFIAAVGLLGPADMDAIRRAAHAMLAPPPERHAEFEALFRAWFTGETHAVASAERSPRRVEDGLDGGRESPSAPPRASGRAASAAETFSRLEPDSGRSDMALARLRRQAGRALPRRTSARRRPLATGEGVDLRRSLRSIVRHDGDLPRPCRCERERRQRPVLVLIDVSGSMKEHAETCLRFAHALGSAADRVETFTFGTRLTRVTRALAARQPGVALERAAGQIRDWSGGTRIGEALEAFLSVPRFAACARGALVVVISDALERGEHARMTVAVRHLGARAWRIAWLTPLAADPGFRPQTAALRSILPLIDHLGDGGSIPALVHFVLSLAGGAPLPGAHLARAMQGPPRGPGT